MNKIRSAKKVLITLLVALMFIGTVSIFATAGDTIANKALAYGEIVPTDAQLKAQKTSYTFYGDKGNMYFMRISKGKQNTFFSIEIYSDSAYKNQLRSYTSAYSLTPGNQSLPVAWEFKDVTSGTYYGKCYSYFVDADGNKTIDSASIKTFKINIDRISQKTVQLTGITNTVQGPKISWSTVPTAEVYHVYRRAAGETSWTLIHRSGATASSYIDTTAQSGKTYSYTVRCSYGKIFSKFDVNGLSTLYLATPQISIYGTGAAGSATVKWNAVTGATGYYVYRKGGSLSDYNWKLIAVVKNGKATSYTDTTATSTDWRYTYTVRAYNGNYISYYNYYGVNFDYLPAPTLTRAYSYADGMRIEWNTNNTNIINYYVYRKNGTAWTFLGQTKDKYFIDKTAVSGNTYTYTVKALSATNAGGFNSTGITNRFIGTTQLNKLTFDVNNRSVITWKPVTGAAGYDIYRKINNAAGWTWIAKVKNPNATYYFDACAKTSDTTYAYTIRAFDSNNIYGYFMVDGSSAKFLSMPVFTSQQIATEDDSLCIETKWDAVVGATAYNVYRRDPGGPWHLLQTATPELSYLDTDIECGIKYDYTVRALNDDGDMSYFYAKSATAITVPTLESVVVTDEGVKLNWNAVDNVDFYTVYRQAKGSETWEKLGTVETNEYIDASEEGKTQPYYYTVSATFGEIESATKDGVPNFVEIEINTEFVNATEEKPAHIKVLFECPTAEAVEIYKSINGETPLLLNITEEFEDIEIEEGNTYTYTISALATGKVTGVESSSVKYPYPPLEAPVITACEGDYNNGESTVTLTWNEVAYADEYVILRATVDSEWIEIGTVKAETEEEPEVVSEESEIKTYTFTDTNVAAEIVYGYKIKAVATTSERASSESEPTEIIVYTPLDSVTGIKITPEKAANDTIILTITWDATKFAENYTVYQKTENSEWIEIYTENTAEGNRTCTTTVNINTKYSYKVTASAPNRGTVSNEESFCWTEVLAPVDPETETCLDIVDDSAFVSGDYIVTDYLICEDIEQIAAAKEGYTVKTTQSHQGAYGTGSIIEVCKDGETVITYKLIVKGDVNGDSTHDILDCTIIEKLINGNKATEEIFIFAADLDNDGEITVNDYNMAKTLI